jgi:putative transposase
MSEYRRWFVPGGTFFFTVVTERRTPIFADEHARRLLGRVLRSCRQRYPFEIMALVLLPEHLHAIWSLPGHDTNYSLRWGWIKREFTRGWLALGGRERERGGARVRERRRGVWQRRFWEHTVRDEDDLAAHFDYIHFNPVKHGLVQRPRDWRWSTFHRWVRAGHYSANWAAASNEALMPGGAGE